MSQKQPVAPEDCPTPQYHATHRYCPSCSWTEPQPRPSFCTIDWQGPSDETCTDDLLVISCVNRKGHGGHHVGWYKDDDQYVFWRTGTSDLEMVDGTIKQAQFTPTPESGENTVTSASDDGGAR